MEDMCDIFLVGDNEYNVEFILEALARHKLAHRVRVFRDGGEALDYLLAAERYSDRFSARQPRLILLDLRLPRVDGLELLRVVRTNETTKMIPVVVFSSSTDDADRMESYRLAANSFIIKPVAYERFVETVAEIGYYWAIQNAPPLMESARALKLKNPGLIRLTGRGLIFYKPGILFPFAAW
jgi:two-component system response regulator